MPFADDDDYGGRTVVEKLDDAHRWRLVRPVRYTGSGGDVFTAPAGFVTDFASVPRIAVWLVPVFGKYTRAAILHDWPLADALPAGLVTSVDADGLFRAALRELGTPPVLRWLMWAGVRWSALTTPRRRPGWWSTFPATAGVTLAVAVTVVIPAAMLAVALGLALYSLAELVATGGSRGGTLST